MSEIPQNPENHERIAPQPGEIYRHRDGLFYKVIEYGIMIADERPIDTVRYVQLEAGGMPAGSVWTRRTGEFLDSEIFKQVTKPNEDILQLRERVKPTEREQQEDEPAVEQIFDDEKVVGYGYDVTGYETSHDFSRTVRCELLQEKYGLPVGTIIERRVPSA